MSGSQTTGAEEHAAQQSLHELIASLQRERSERARAEEALLELVAGTAGVTGEQFFPALVQHLASALHVRFATLAELVPGDPTRLRTLGLWANDDWESTYEYPRAGTPCDRAVQEGMYYCPNHVQERFPQDHDLVEMGAESYMGVRLTSEAGETLGHICVLDDKPLLDEGRSRSILTIFAARASAELERQRTQESLQRVADRLSVMLEGLPVVSYRSKPDGDFGATFMSSNVSDLTGFAPEDFTSNSSLWEDRIHPEDAPLVMGSMPELFKTGRHEHEYRWRVKDGSYRWFFDSHRIVKRPDGTVSHIVGMWQDVTERVRAERALRASEERFRQLAEHANVGIWQISPEGQTIYINPAMCRMLELSSSSDLNGQTYHQFFSDESLRRMRQEHAKRPSGVRSSYEAEIIGARGGRRNIIVFGAPVRSAEDGLQSLIGTFADITPRKLAEERQALLMQELDHRVKNNLAAVMSVAEQTLTGARTLEEFGSAFAGRLQAMSIAHEMLARTSWDGAELRQMLERVIEPHERGHERRFELEGEPQVLSAKVAPSLCMVIHELVGNAVKYGSLSTPEGRVRIAWHTQATTPGQHQLHLSWKEEHGPRVALPERRGFGTELIEQMIRYQLRGRTQLKFEETGVVCDIVVPLAAGEPGAADRR